MTRMHTSASASAARWSKTSDISNQAYKEVKYGAMLSRAPDSSNDGVVYNLLRNTKGIIMTIGVILEQQSLPDP